MRWPVSFPLTVPLRSAATKLSRSVKSSISSQALPSSRRRCASLPPAPAVPRSRGTSAPRGVGAPPYPLQRGAADVVQPVAAEGVRHRDGPALVPDARDGLLRREAARYVLLQEEAD